MSEWERTLVRHMSTLYSSLKQGIDTVQSTNQELRAIIIDQHADIKGIKEEQRRLGSVLQDIASQLEKIQSSTLDVSYDLQDVKQEVSICTAGFIKINSALLQLNMVGVPQGKIPTLQNYKFESNPTVASTKEDMRSTPTKYTRSKLQELMTGVAMPASKIPIMITMLENRTPRVFSMCLPQLNPHAKLSDSSAKDLINMTKIDNKDELQLAFSCLRDLLQKTDEAGTSSTQDPVPTPSPNSPPIAEPGSSQNPAKYTLMRK